jgi:hypothetical protein
VVAFVITVLPATLNVDAAVAGGIASTAPVSSVSPGRRPPALVTAAARLALSPEGAVSEGSDPPHAVIITVADINITPNHVFIDPPDARIRTIRRACQSAEQRGGLTCHVAAVAGASEVVQRKRLTIFREA